MNKKSQYLLFGMVLSWVAGVAGADRFYKGEFGLGVLKLVTLGGFGIWFLIDAAIWTRDFGASLK